MSTAEEKLAAITAIILGSASETEHSDAAYNTPELSVNDVVADGTTINKDGSVWTVSQNAYGVPTGEKFRSSYGYISKGKDPELWAMIQTTMGAEAFARWNGQRSPWALYGADVKPYLKSGAANMVTLSMLLNSYANHVQ